MDIKSKIRTIPHWPIEGVMFRDITTLWLDPEANKEAYRRFYEQYKDKKIDKIVGIDARGFVFGAVLAYQLDLPFVPVRKKGKLPGDTVGAEYTLEYGANNVEMHVDAINKGDKCVIIDDLIATGGTIAAAIKLVEELGGEVAECAFVIELPDLHGRDQIKGYDIFALMEFEGE